MAGYANTNVTPNINRTGLNLYVTVNGKSMTIDSILGATASGTNTYTITTGKSLTAYYTWQAFLVLFTNGNTASSTLNVDSIGAITLKKTGSTNLSSGDIASGQVLLCVYDGTNFQVIGIGGSGGAGTPGGADTQVQFNDSGSFNGEADFAYNKTTNRLTVDYVAVDDDAYDATTWNANLDVPTKNAIRDKIETLEPAITTLPISKGGTNSNAALNNNRVMKSSGGAVVEAAAITAAKALKSDANGIPVHFDTATEPSLTELAYVKGVTSAIQTQLDSKLASADFTYVQNKISLWMFNAY